MERPALQRMLADINQGLIDITNRLFSDRTGVLHVATQRACAYLNHTRRATLL